MLDVAKVEEFLRRHYHLIVVLMLVLLLVSLIAAGASIRIGHDTLTIEGEVNNSTVNNSTVEVNIYPSPRFDHLGGSTLPRVSFEMDKT